MNLAPNFSEPRWLIFRVGLQGWEGGPVSQGGRSWRPSRAGDRCAGSLWHRPEGPPWVLHGPVLPCPLNLRHSVFSSRCPQAPVTLRLLGSVFDPRHGLPPQFWQLALQPEPEPVTDVFTTCTQLGPVLFSPLDTPGPALLPSQAPGSSLPKTLVLCVPQGMFCPS